MGWSCSSLPGLHDELSESSQAMSSVSSDTDDDGDVLQMLESFTEDCCNGENKYWFNLKVERVFEVNNPKLENEFCQVQTRLRGQTPNIQRLYHGTSGGNAQAIISDGFKLPKHSGMFGKGVYLAKTPLKSWQYSTRDEYHEYRSHYMLVCDVALGSEREMTAAGAPCRRASLVDVICRRPMQQTMCDSVKGLAVEQGGS